MTLTLVVCGVTDCLATAGALDGGVRRLSGESQATGGKAMVARFELDPVVMVVKRGAKATLRVCAYYGPETDAMEGFGFPCRWVTQVATSNWAVNWKVGGDPVFGRVSGKGGRGVYQAPPDRPEPQVVHVSVHVSALDHVFEVDLRSNLSIYPPDLAGTLSFKLEAWPGTPQVVTLWFAGNVALDWDTEYRWDEDKKLVYTMDGYLALRTLSFRAGALTCTNTSAAQQNFPASVESPVYFHLWSPVEGPTSAHFVLDPLGWHFVCTPGEYQWPMTVTFGLLSGLEGQGCTTPEWVPMRAEQYPSGEFKATFNLGVHYDAEWSLWPDGSPKWSRLPP